MDQCAVFVDAGYLLAAGAELCFGEKTPRHEFTCQYEDLAALVVRLVVEHGKLPLLRVYWYDAGRNNQPDFDQRRIGALPSFKLRLGRLSSRGEQKGVDSLIFRDLMTLSRERVMSAAYLIAGDEDLREGVLVAQDLGVRVILVGIPPGVDENQSPTLVREADEHILFSKNDLSPCFARRAPSPTQRQGSERTESPSSVGVTPTPQASDSAADTSPGSPAGMAPPSAENPTDSELELVERTAHEFAERWARSVTADQILAVLSEWPKIPQELYRELGHTISAALGRRIADLPHLARPMRTEFWRTLRNIGRAVRRSGGGPSVEAAKATEIETLQPAGQRQAVSPENDKPRVEAAEDPPPKRLGESAEVVSSSGPSESEPSDSESQPVLRELGGQPAETSMAPSAEIEVATTAEPSRSSTKDAELDSPSPGSDLPSAASMTAPSPTPAKRSRAPRKGASPGERARARPKTAAAASPKTGSDIARDQYVNDPYHVAVPGDEAVMAAVVRISEEDAARLAASDLRLVKCRDCGKYFLFPYDVYLSYSHLWQEVKTAEVVAHCGPCRRRTGRKTFKEELPDLGSFPFDPDGPQTVTAMAAGVRISEEDAARLAANEVKLVKCRDCGKYFAFPYDVYMSCSLIWQEGKTAGVLAYCGPCRKRTGRKTFKEELRDFGLFQFDPEGSQTTLAPARERTEARMDAQRAGSGPGEMVRESGASTPGVRDTGARPPSAPSRKRTTEEIDREAEEWLERPNVWDVPLDEAVTDDLVKSAIRRKATEARLKAAECGENPKLLECRDCRRYFPFPYVIRIYRELIGSGRKTVTELAHCETCRKQLALKTFEAEVPGLGPFLYDPVDSQVVMARERELSRARIRELSAAWAAGEWWIL